MDRQKDPISPRNVIDGLTRRTALKVISLGAISGTPLSLADEASAQNQTQLLTSFEEENVGDQEPADPWYLFNDTGIHEVSDGRASNGSQSFRTADATPGNYPDPSAIAMDLDLTDVEDVLFDVYAANNNPNQGNINVSLDNAGTFSDGNINIWGFPQEMDDRGESRYGGEGQWWRDNSDQKGVISDSTGVHPLIFWIDGDQDVYWDNIRLVTTEDEISLELDNVRLIQTVENSHVPGIRENIPDPVNVEGRKTAVVFGLRGDREDVFDSFDSLSNLQLWLTFNAASTPDFTFQLKKERIASVMDQKDIIDEALRLGDTLDDLFVDSNYPTFEINEEIESVKLEIHDSQFSPEDAKLIRGEDYTTTKTPELNLGFIPVRDSAGGQNYGSDGNGGPSSYDSTVRDTIRYIRKAYPVNEVNAYVHNKSDPVLGTETRRHYPRDLKDARNELEKVINDFGTLSVEEGLNGDIYTIRDGEIVENPNNTEITSFDETVAIVPDGSNEHYFEYHLAGRDKLGVHIAKHAILGIHPQTSSGVLEKGSSAYPPLNNHGAGFVGGHEIGHHFMDELYSDDFANLANDGDSTHARDELVSTMIKLEAEKDNSSLEVEDEVRSLMSSPPTPLWPDEHAFQQLSESQFDPEPPKIDSGIATQTVIGGAIIMATGKAELESIHTLVREGKPMPHTLSGDVIITLKDVAEGTIDQLSTMSQVITTFSAGEGVVDGIGLFTIPFPEETYRVTFEVDGITTVITPVVKSLFDAVSAIPNSGFKRVPDQRRKALNNKLDEVEKKMDEKEFQEAKQKLDNDIRRMIKRWLKDDYDAAANQPTKQGLLDLVDDMVARLETLEQTNNTE